MEIKNGVWWHNQRNSDLEEIESFKKELGDDSGFEIGIEEMLQSNWVERRGLVRSINLLAETNLTSAKNDLNRSTLELAHALNIPVKQVEKEIMRRRTMFQKKQRKG